MATIQEKGAALLERADVVVLASVGKEGYPRPVPMSKIKSEGVSVVWMATGRHSQKTNDFQNNPKAGVCAYEMGNSVALTGEVSVVTDDVLKKQYWQEWFIEHFPKGPDDPEYVLLKFTACRGTFWIDGQFVHKQL